MSKQRFFKSVDTDLHNEIAKIVLKRQQYKCFYCGVKNNAIVHKQSDGSYYELDAHEQEFFKNSGVKPLKIHLRVIQTIGINGSTDPIDYKALCPHHSQKVLREKIIEIKKKNIGDLSKVRVRHIQEVKNFIFNCTGKMIITKDCVGLIMRLEQVLNSNK